MTTTPDDIESTADAIAARGVKRIQVADRSHTFFSPKELREDAQLAAADDLDEDYGGFIDLTLKNPS
jgi:hypothetical protein